MIRVHYNLFGDWYSVDMPDMSTARAFACDFLEYWFEVVKICDDFCGVNEILRLAHGRTSFN